MKKFYSLLFSLVVATVLIGIPLTTIAQAKVIQDSYLMNTKKEYIYNFYGGLKTYDFVGVNKTGTLKNYNHWNVTIKDQKGKKVVVPSDEIETSKGLFDRNEIIIPNPVKIGQKWHSEMLDYTLISVNKTVKVPAGTFKNVLELKVLREDGTAYIYYAKNVGRILTVVNGKRTDELKAIKNK